MKKLILHIGTYKTGTSYLQTVLASNRKSLSSKGIYYPSGSFVNHSVNFFPLFDHRERLNAFTIAKFGQISKDEILANCKKYWIREFEKFKSSNAHTFIISAELLCKLSEKSICTMRDFIMPYFDEIKILCYARGVKSLLVSTIQELLKNGSISLDRAPAVIENFMDIKSTVQAYESAFGENQVVVRPFDKNRMRNHDLLCDFMHIILPNRSIEMNLNHISSNTSLGHNSAVFLSEYNKVYPLHDKMGNLNVDRKPMIFFQDIQQEYDKKIELKLPITLETAQRFNDQYDYIDQKIGDGFSFDKLEPSNEKDFVYDYKAIPKDFLFHIIKEYEERLAVHHDIGVKVFIKQKVKKYKKLLFKKHNEMTKIN
jgi:hypothetical protein